MAEKQEFLWLTSNIHASVLLLITNFAMTSSKWGDSRVDRSLPHRINYKFLCLSADWRWKLANGCPKNFCSYRKKKSMAIEPYLEQKSRVQSYNFRSFYFTCQQLNFHLRSFGLKRFRMTWKIYISDPKLVLFCFSLKLPDLSSFTAFGAAKLFILIIIIIIHNWLLDTDSKGLMFPLRKISIQSKTERKRTGFFFRYSQNLVRFKKDSYLTNFPAGFQLVSFERIDLSLNMKIIFRRIDNRDKTTSHWATRSVLMYHCGLEKLTVRSL